MKPTNGLAHMLRQEGIVLAPGAYDGLSAKIIEQAGFQAVYMTGFGTAASVLGQPDVGLLSMTEMVSHAANIVSAVSIPVIADADTGYGNPINVGRTVREYERAGVAAVQIEDQAWPKKCGHMEGKVVIPKEEMVQKVRAAADARVNKDFLIIARTDARAVHGIEDAINRAQSYADAGADVLFVEAPQSAAEIEHVAKSLSSSRPLLFNTAFGGKTPAMPVDKLEAMGYKIVIFPIDALMIASRSITVLMQELKSKHSTQGLWDRMTSFQDFNELIGLPRIRALESRYGVDQVQQGSGTKALPADRQR